MANKRRRLRKVPLFIEARLASIGNEFHVAVAKRISITDIQAGLYAHVGVLWKNGQVEVQNAPVLPPEYGRFARLNVEGRVIVRKDLPKVDKNITFINPRLFGIPGNSCTITQTRRVFQREHLPASRFQLEAAILLVGDDSCIFRFNIRRVFSSSEPNIGRELLFSLNLLHEAVGSFNVFASTASAQEYLSTIHVQWEILPAGERENNICLILSSFRPHTQEEKEELERRANERYDFFETLGPKHIIRGTGGMDGYMGALIKDDIVVFEHLTPGNGIYLLFADWSEQSKRTKTDLLSHAEQGKDFIRITHTGDWQTRVHNVLASRLA
jgi:hypothetical protein